MIFSNKYILINKSDLLKISTSLKKSSRIILHKKNSVQQEMIIAQKKNYYYPIKKNIQSDQTFTLLHGKLLLLIFDNKGKIIKKVLLQKNKNIICRIKKNTYHCDIALSNIAIHLETKFGIFTKKTNKFANFKNSIEIINKELKNIKY
tara:strand:+ start:2530 stop:2973 length:444 start_codon:yes stop_codon:yes gene_type:complete